MDIDLSQYVRVGRYDLPEPTRTSAPVGNVLAQEVSGVTYNWDTDTLFVVGDGGTSVTQIDKMGNLIDTMTLAPGGSSQGTEFFDPEGITYVGNGQFVMTEERDRNAVLFTYSAGTTLTRADTQTAHIGTNVGNVGLEGLSYDPLTNGFIFVKEKTPESVFQTTIDFATDTASNGSASTVASTDLFDPTLLNLIDIADVFALSNISSAVGADEEGNLLILSQESAQILEVDRSGNILSSLAIQADPGNPLDVVSQQHEGLTMDANGYLYVVSENGGGDFDHPQLWVYAPSSVANVGPTAVSLVNALAAIDENTSTVARIKVADVAIADDGLGTNVFSLSGADVAYFEVDSTGLYIKAGTVLDYESRTSYSVTVNVDDTSVGATPDASTSHVLNVTDIVNENVAPAVYISEVAPWSSGNSPVGADWFEVTNGGSSTLDITGWRVDDGSASFANSAALTGVSSIAAGQSVIFIETSSAATVTSFIDTWFGGTLPSNVQIGTYSGSGLGLSTGGDGVTLFDAGGSQQAIVSFGASPATTPFTTFNNAAGLNNATLTTPSQTGVNGAFVAPADVNEIGSPGTVGRLFISEVAPWSSGNSPVGADWFEVTNTTAFDIDLTGWKVDDSSQSPAAAVALNGITTIHAGESVIFLESATPSTAIASFVNTWFGGNAPAGLQIGSYTGSGIGLSTGGDGVNLYDPTNALRASVSFGASPTGPYPTFDNAAALNGVALTTLSAAGTNGAFNAVNDAAEAGSPGTIVATNYVPTFTSPGLFAVAENRLLAATLTASDLNSDTLTYAISGGADQALFSIDAVSGAISFLAAPDFETPGDADQNNVYALDVSVTDGIGNAVTQSITIGITDVAEPGLTIKGGRGADVLVGTAGDDTINGDNGDDQIAGNDGNDVILGGSGLDHIDGGRGADIVSGDAGADFIDGGLGDDTLFGGNANDQIFGGGGDDMLFGDTGNDMLWGGAGDDLLDGGLGKNVLTGDEGADSFLLGLRGTHGLALIADFMPDVDHLQLSATQFGLAAGPLDPSMLVFGTKAADHHAEFIYNAASGRLLWDADGIGGTGPVMIAALENHASISHSDLILV